MQILKFILLFCTYQITAQNSYIINGDFEENSPIENWSYTSYDFNQIFETWYSPTKTSPDLFGPNFPPPKKWTDLGFGKIDPASGEYFIGFTLYGCNKGKPHCREYLSTHLKQNLRYGRTYVLELWIASMQNSTRINHFGYHLHQDSLHQATFGVLDSINQYHSLKIGEIPYNTWTVLRDTFVVNQTNLSAITFGNFDQDTEVVVFDKNANLPFAYYYLDNIRLYELNRSPTSNISYQSWFPLKTGKKIVLDKVYFKFDTDTLTQDSYPQLLELVHLMRSYPRMQVKIYGHTDALGNDSYNILLSQKRAQKVYNILLEKGIHPDRLSSIGMGETSPIKSNFFPKGRAANRRVEFEIISIE